MCGREGVNWVNLEKIDQPGYGIINFNKQDYKWVAPILNFNGYASLSMSYEVTMKQTGLIPTPAKNALVT